MARSLSLAKRATCLYGDFVFQYRFVKKLVIALFAFLLVCGARPASAAGLDSFGICDHLVRYDDTDAAIDEIIASGVKWVRIGVEWGNIEPNSGEMGNPPTVRLTRFDSIVDRLADHGVNMVFILGFTAPWASSNPTSPDASRYKPANWSTWENYVQFVTNRYIGRIHYWEVWNEPDHNGFWKSSVQDFATLLEKAAGQIRATDPTNKVLLGGLAMTNGTGDSYGLGTFFDTLLGLGAASNFDIIAYHAYGDGARLLNLYNGMQAVIAKYGLGSRKIWITEAGYTSLGDAAKEAAKADYVDQTYKLHFGLNIEKLFWYVHRNPNVAGNASESNFGLIANDRTPLKALYYYQAVAGAESDFKLQKEYPSQVPTRRTLNYVPATGGDGGSVVDYAPDGSTKRIPATKYMYFRVNDNWLNNANSGLDSRVYVDVTYLNSGTGGWGFQYDATSSAYKNINYSKTNTGAWVTTTLTLDDAKFANSQNNQADFRLYAAGSDLIVSKVVVRKDMTGARIVLGNPDQFRYATRPDETDSTKEAYNPLTTIGGKSCRQILANNKYIYAKVSDSVARAGDTKVKVGIWFWDAGTDSLLLQYNAVGASHKSYPIAKTNTLAWRYVTVNLTDANFTNGQSYGGDFRIGNNFDGSVEYISQIDVEKVP